MVAAGYNVHMIRRVLRTTGIAFCFALLSAGHSLGVDRVVSTTAQFSAALAAAGAGDQIILQPGVYGGGHYRANLQQVTIRSADPANPAIIDGGSNGIQLSDAANVTISDLVFRNQVDNGLNIDDGGTFDTPAVNLTLRNITVRDIVTAGNHDGIKLSGVNDFLIENVQVLNWGTGGSAVDMVGCHRGLIQNSNFIHTNSANAGTTLQPKGGSKDITFRANRIELPRGSGRAVQAGGSTGTPFFRFVDGDSGYEANQIVAEGNVIIGGSSSFSWVNIDGGVFHHNVVSRPGQWVARILNENGGLPIVDTQNGIFQDNRIVYNDTASEFSTAVNVGPETLPEHVHVRQKPVAEPGEPHRGRLDAQPAGAGDGRHLRRRSSGNDRWSARLEFCLGKVDRERERHATIRRRYRAAVDAAGDCRRRRDVRPAGCRPAGRRLDVDECPHVDAAIAGIFASHLDRSGRLPELRLDHRRLRRERAGKFAGLQCVARLILELPTLRATATTMASSMRPTT